MWRNKGNKLVKQTTSVTQCERTDKQTLEKNQSQAIKKKVFFFLIRKKKPTQAFKKFLN
jgi:hypothetical protein